MNMDTAIYFTELLLAIALIQQSLEHIRSAKDEKLLFSIRIILSILLFAGLWTKWVCLALFVNGIFILKRFQGPYNGGSDRMGMLVLFCLCLVHFTPVAIFREIALGYLALQVMMSYFVAGCMKFVHKDWRNGQALEDLFRFSAFVSSESIRALADRKLLIVLMSWMVISFELAFPFTIISKETLIIGLIAALIFHITNSITLGFNRFIWVWLAAYPSVIWLQERIF